MRNIREFNIKILLDNIVKYYNMDFSHILSQHSIAK